MKNLLLLIIISALFFACDSENKETNDSKKNNVEKSNKNDNEETDIVDQVDIEEEVVPASEVDDFIKTNYGEYFDFDQIYFEPDQAMYTKDDYYVFLYNIYEGMNGEGDEGFMLVVTVDESDFVIDHVELSTGSFGDVTEVWSEIELLPDNYVYKFTEENGLENADMGEDGMWTGDPYTDHTFTLITIDEDGYIGDEESQSESLAIQENYNENKNDVLVKTIRRYYGIVEQKVSNERYSSYEYKTGDNDIYEYQWDDSWFNKITYKKMDGPGVRYTEYYYFIRNNLFFAYIIDNERQTEERYYYHHDNLKVALLGKDKNPQESKEFSGMAFNKEKVENIIEIRQTIINLLD